MKKNTKHSLNVIIVLVCLSLMIYFFFPQPPCSLSVFEKRAVWLTYQDLSQLSYKNKKSFQKDFETVVKNIEDYQCNTIIVQVRAFADALYSSKYFPMSQVITNQEHLSFDPLEEMTTIAHGKGMLIEAWINPYRISLNARTYNQFKQNAKQREWLENPNFTIHYGEYQYILNPANLNVRHLIVSGVEEVVENYNVDGIHFDDYFYVPKTHGETTVSERMDNVNMLIQDVYQSIKRINRDVTFGISPQGNYENCINEGADVDTWLKEEGYVDYLMPQIYWSDQYGQNGRTALFSERAKRFAKIKRHQNIKLYAGLALYQAGQTLKMDQGWLTSSHNISDQVQILHEKGYDGYGLFRYDFILRKAGQKEMGELLRNHQN